MPDDPLSKISELVNKFSHSGSDRDFVDACEAVVFAESVHSLSSKEATRRIVGLTKQYIAFNGDPIAPNKIVVKPGGDNVQS